MIITLFRLDEKNMIQDALVFPVNPEELSVNRKTRFESYSLIKGGNIDIPNGNELTAVSWSAFFPGAGIKNISVFTWAEPQYFTMKLLEWKANGTKLRLLATETPINIDVYIDEYNTKYRDGTGTHYYDITFRQAKDLKIKFEIDTEAQTRYQQQQVVTGEQTQASRPQPPQQKTYKIVAADSWWKIAQKVLSNGARYMEIYNLNKDKYRGTGQMLQVGDVIKIP